MNTSWKSRVPTVLLTALVVAVLFWAARAEPVRAEREAAAPSAGPRYSVVETEAHNLIVTDNKTNTLYFYTIDKDKEVGSELKLRGTLDLNQVGKPGLQPSKPKSE